MLKNVSRDRVFLTYSVICSILKEVVLCYVVYDTTNREIDLSTPSCLKQMSILDILVNRWIPKENRDSNIDDQSKVNKAGEVATSSLQSYFESFNDLDDD